jgi:hypothetical protein
MSTQVIEVDAAKKLAFVAVLRLDLLLLLLHNRLLGRIGQ